MTMHMVGPHMTTTKYNRKKPTKKTPRQLEAEARHQEFLKKMGVDDESLKRKLSYDHKGRRKGINEIPDYKSTKPQTVLSNKVAAHGAAVEPKEYSGERQLIGIATMHKSNLVPVFADKKQDAIDIARMRR